MVHPSTEEPSGEPQENPFELDMNDEDDVLAGAIHPTDHPYETEISQLKEQLMRALAETENVRKRAARDVEETNKYAIAGFARQLVSVIENLQRANSSIPPELMASNEQVKTLAQGVEMTMSELLKVFERNGIKRVYPELGEKFDHHFHQAMAQIEDPTAEPGTVLQVFQAGYVIHDRLLQPALVNVAKRVEPAASQLDTNA